MLTQKPTEPIPGTTPPPFSDNEPAHDEQEALERYDTPPLRNKGCFVRAFSFKGRITRTEWALTHAVILIALLVAGCALDIYCGISALFVGEEPVALIHTHMMRACLVALAWLLVAQGVKRCHDVNWCGWLIYVPFLGLVLLFKRGTDETNRYGLPAVIKEEGPEGIAWERRLRMKGLVCALAWLICSPVYLALAVKWRIQKPMARLALLILSPLVVCFVSTTHSAIERQRHENRMETQARRFLTKETLGVELGLTDIAWQTRQATQGEATYVLTLKGMPPAETLSRIEELAKQSGSGWAVFVDESAVQSEDYGYYYEDYGGTASADTSATPKQPEYYQFTKNISLKGERNATRVSLTIKRHDVDAMLTLTPQDR